MGQLCTCTRSQAYGANKVKGLAPKSPPEKKPSRRETEEVLSKYISTTESPLTIDQLHLHHPAYRQTDPAENGISAATELPSPIDSHHVNGKLSHSKTTDDSGIFSKTSSSSSADDRPSTATNDRQGTRALEVTSSAGLRSASGDNLQEGGLLVDGTMVPHDVTSSTFSMISAGSTAFGAAPDATERLIRLRQLYESRIRRLLLQSVDLLAEELSPASLAGYLRRTRPQQGDATDGELLAELFGGPEGISPDLEVAASILKDLLWDVVTCRGLENFDDFCVCLRENGQESLASLIESIDQLLAIVAPDQSLPDPQMESCACCPCCKNLEEDNRIDSSDCFDTSRDFNIELIGWDGENTNEKSKSLSQKYRPYDSSTSMGQSGTDLELLPVGALPQLSVRFYRYCLCVTQRLGRLEGVLREQGGGCVRELSLIDCHLGCAVLEGERSWLMSSLNSNQSLVKLDVRLSCLGDGGCTGLGEGLSGNSVLRHLNLASSGLTENSCSLILSKLFRHLVLSDLDLGFNEIRDLGCRAIAGSSLVRRGGTLRRLRLRDNGITSEGASCLAAALIGNSRLALLDISSNSIGNDGAARLADALISNRSLRDLDLENCGVSEGGCAAMARALRANGALRRLQLSLNPLEDMGAKALSGGLRYNRGLESLSLNMCAIGNAGFESLLDALYVSNGTIRLIKLCYNDIGGMKHDIDGGWEARQPSLNILYQKLRELLHRNEDMKMLLWGNDLEDLPAFSHYLSPVEGEMAGLSDAVSLTLSDNTASVEVSPAVISPRTEAQIWRCQGPMLGPVSS